MNVAGNTSTPRTVVGQISGLVNGRRMDVALTKTPFGFRAAVAFDNIVYSRWGRTPSDAVTSLGLYLKRTVK